VRNNLIRSKKLSLINFYLWYIKHGEDMSVAAEEQSPIMQYTTGQKPPVSGDGPAPRPCKFWFLWFTRGSEGNCACCCVCVAALGPSNKIWCPICALNSLRNKLKPTAMKAYGDGGFAPQISYLGLQINPLSNCSANKFRFTSVFPAYLSFATLQTYQVFVIFSVHHGDDTSTDKSDFFPRRSFL